MLINKIIVFLFNWSILAVNCNKRHFRTFAGEEADIKKVPYTVYVSGGCTGALVGPEWVLTAANCFAGLNFENSFVGFSTSDKNESYLNVGIKNVYIHPDYYNDNSDSLGARHDLALLQLVAPAIISESLKILELEETDWPKLEPRYCTLAGFGRNIDNDTSLHFSAFNVTQGCDCIEDKGILCTKIVKDGDDSPCFGDAGSVLVCDNRGVGVTSHTISATYCDIVPPENENTGTECARSNTYFLFSHIQPHLQWYHDLVPKHYLSSKANRHTMKSSQHYDIITSVHLYTLLIIFCSHFY